MVMRTLRIMAVGAAFFMLGATPAARADIAADLNSFFNSAGLMTNTTPPGAYQGQTAGYYTGGGLFARAPSRNFNLVTVQAPSFRAGCGGIDIFTGGFSFVNSDQLVAAMRNIGQNALGLAFQIGLSTLSPKLAELIQEFTTLANKVNQFNINSCESAATLMGSVLPRSDQSSQALCGLIGTNNGLFSDYAASRQGCGAAGQRSDTLRQASTNPGYKDMVPAGNITWRALQKNSATAGDSLLAEFMMTLAGTAVIPIPASDDQPRQVFPYPPLPVTDELLTAFLEGTSSATLPFFYRCMDGYGENACTQINKVSNYPLPASFTGFRKSVEDQLNTIISEIEADRSGSAGTLPASTLNLIGNSRIPVLKILTVYAAYSPNFARSQTRELSQLIALDLLDLYLSQAYDMIRSSLQTLAFDEDKVDALDRQVRQQQVRASTLIKSYQDRIYRLVDLQMKTMTMERALVSRLSPGLADAYDWGRTVQ